MKVSTKWEGNLAFTMSNPDGNQVRMDARNEAGGEGSGVSPMEAGLGGTGRLYGNRYVHDP